MNGSGDADGTPSCKWKLAFLSDEFKFISLALFIVDYKNVNFYGVRSNMQA